MERPKLVKSKSYRLSLAETPREEFRIEIFDD